MESRLAEIERLQSQMEQVRRELDLEFHDLVQSARAAVSWRRQWRKHPWALAATAMAVGYVLVPSRRVPRIDSIQAASLSASTPSPTRRLVAELAGALLGMAARRGIRSLGMHIEQVLANGHRRVDQPGREPGVPVDGHEH